MTQRTITRVALLQSFDGRPELLFDLLDELPAKGYAAVFLAALGDTTTLRGLCEKADRLGLKVGLFTGFMKYDYRYLAQHREQQMVFAEAANDQDDLGMSGWGCPFNPEFKARYFAKLRELAALPGVWQIDLNDEAFLGSGCYCAVCRAAWAADIGGPMPCKPRPVADDWKDPRWRTYLGWRIRRWHAVHREMADVIRLVNPAIRASFQSSPAVDLWMNPWHSGVDLAGMAEYLDAISTDPYYTFHRRIFDPAEVYLSEWSRFLAGIMPEGKHAGIYPQGFSHPTFTRPLGPDDGLWSAIIPPAVGASYTCAFSYTLQKCSPVQATYESAFRLDRYFERCTPLRYAAIVHGLKSEMYRYPLPMETPSSYDGTRAFPVAAALRHAGLPYGWLPDTALGDARRMESSRVLVLPDIACMSLEERESLRRFVDGGGRAVILGDLGSADETGGETGRSLLEELTGIRLREPLKAPGEFCLIAPHPAAERLQPIDEESARRYMDGTMRPLFSLAHGWAAEAPADADVLAGFTDGAGHPTGGPAIVSSRRHGGRVLWLAGFPTRTVGQPAFGTTVLNRAHELFARLVEHTAGGAPALRVEGWPPMVPMRRLRPMDQRYMPTCEFFALAGDDGFLGIVTSYFREPTEFPLALDVPAGRTVRAVRELLAGQPVPFTVAGGTARVNVQLGFNTAALAFWFELGP